MIILYRMLIEQNHLFKDQLYHFSVHINTLLKFILLIAVDHSSFPQKICFSSFFEKCLFSFYPDYKIHPSQEFPFSAKPFPQSKSSKSTYGKIHTVSITPSTVIFSPSKNSKLWIQLQIFWFFFLLL